jgi:hypothetical protein
MDLILHRLVMGFFVSPGTAATNVSAEATGIRREILIFSYLSGSSHDHPAHFS